MRGLPVWGRHGMVRRMLTRETIDAAAARLAPHVRRTPVLRLGADVPGAPGLMLKLEFLQHTGSFKARGAFNRLSCDGGSGGVAAASGGNHGAAVAYAARSLGRAATIFVPAPTPEVKVERIGRYGAKLVRGGANYAEAAEACRAFADAHGLLNVHAYDHEAVLAGQGTVGRELEADAPECTHVLVAVGGGGLIGGVAGWYLGGPTTVVAVEPEQCPTLHAALAAGRPVPVATGGHASDSLGASQVGVQMFAVAQAAGLEAVLVPDSSIRAAQLWLWDRLRIVAEPGGATALAPLLDGRWTPPPGARVAVILCGANTTPDVSRET